MWGNSSARQRVVQRKHTARPRVTEIGHRARVRYLEEAISEVSRADS